MDSWKTMEAMENSLRQRDALLKAEDGRARPRPEGQPGRQHDASHGQRVAHYHARAASLAHSAYVLVVVCQRLQRAAVERRGHVRRPALVDMTIADRVLEPTGGSVRVEGGERETAAVGRQSEEGGEQDQRDEEGAGEQVLGQVGGAAHGSGSNMEGEWVWE